MANSLSFDVAIIGGGIAGLSTALRLPAHLSVALFTKGQLGESNTRYAQGGLTAALGADDSPALHVQDTLAAGAGLCDEQAVRIMAESAPAAVRWLIETGVRFDRAQPGDEHATPDGLLLGREAAHSRWRVLHAGGDATGAEIERALTSALRKRSSIALYEETYVRSLVVEHGACTGLEAVHRGGQPYMVYTNATVLASGGAGGLWLHTSNPAGATADGLALAWRAGAALADLEFMQFHPTVLVAGGGSPRSHLISEAVRGEGAYLRNHAGERFMPRYAELAELAPRDVVARAILGEMLREGVDCQYLDLRHLPSHRVHQRFPTISAICRGYGLDLAQDLLPVAPAAHYCMGGVMTGVDGHTSVPGLYAAGEVACTGVHGANRLASNSLLEGLVFGLRLADTLARGSGTNNDPVLPSRRAIAVPFARDAASYDTLLGVQPGEEVIAQVRRALRQVMWQHVSLSRDEAGLLEARSRLDGLRTEILARLPPRPAGVEDDSAWQETVSMLVVAELVIAAALQRRESRGSHWRRDYDFLDDALTGAHYVLTGLSLTSVGAISHYGWKNSSGQLADEGDNNVCIGRRST
jgi:L-aspartate oxidase